MSIEREYPLVNTWGGGSYVARVTGKRDREYGFARDFVRGSPDKANGLLRYSLAELGGPGWAVARDRRRVTVLLELGELSYIDHGEVATGDVLEVVKAASWDGGKCADHPRRVLLEGRPCGDCEREELEEEETARRVGEAAAVGADKEDPF